MTLNTFGLNDWKNGVAVSYILGYKEDGEEKGLRGKQSCSGRVKLENSGKRLTEVARKLFRREAGTGGVERGMVSMYVGKSPRE